VAVRRCLILLAALAPVLAATTGAAAAAERSHVVVIVLENREYGEVIGDPDAPFLNRLAARGALATRYHAIAHPSLPNYLAILGGSTYGVDENCTECMTPGPNLATQLSGAGISWRAYMGGMPSACFLDPEYGSYVKRHNPFLHSAAIVADPKLCHRVVPEERLDADLRQRRLPEFAWLSPDLCDDGHDCELAVADRHLSRLVPRLTSQLGPDGLLAITFDEGTSNVAGGGRVATLLVGPGIAPGTRLGTPLDHYSLLASLERRFGLPRLRHARAARAIPAVLGREGNHRTLE